MEMKAEGNPKPMLWVASSKKDLKKFPDDVQDDVGHALWEAQCGKKYQTAKPMKGFGGASVLEIVEDYDGDAYRAVYTVRFAEVIFVLHCYQKKSKRGTEIPEADMELIKQRIKIAEKTYDVMKKGGEL